MTSPTDAPRPALGELARRAEIVKQCIAAEEGYWRRSRDFTSVEAHALAQATASAKAMLASMCSADSILQLVALASGGAAGQEQDQTHEGKTEKNQPQEPEPSRDATMFAFWWWESGLGRT